MQYILYYRIDVTEGKIPFWSDATPEDTFTKVFEGEMPNEKFNPIAPERMCEWVYDRHNTETPGAPYFHHTSMSVGDVVAFGEVAYACMSVGWEKFDLASAKIAD